MPNEIRVLTLMPVITGREYLSRVGRIERDRCRRHSYTSLPNMCDPSATEDALKVYHIVFSIRVQPLLFDNMYACPSARINNIFCD